ncbi:hypothetical protein Pat9b_0273 [Pantoea sp. At-9b]|nr:hypothetical protein Pat9b_0273 [Pantoea sp. At-9b]
MVSFAPRWFRSPRADVVSVRRCGDRAKGAWPHPLQSRASRQPPSPLRGAFALSRCRRTGVDSLLLNAAFRRIHAAHPGSAHSLSESGWRPTLAARLLLICFLLFAFDFYFLFFIFYFLFFVFSCGLSGGGVGGIRSAERRGKARTSRMDAARERNEPWMANPRGPYGLSDKRGDSAMRCARTPQGADCKGPRPRTFARPPARYN